MQPRRDLGLVNKCATLIFRCLISLGASDTSRGLVTYDTDLEGLSV